MSVDNVNAEAHEGEREGRAAPADETPFVEDGRADQALDFVIDTLAAMGMDAWERAATPREIAHMAQMLEDALQAGAMGLSSNLMDHDGDDRPVPSLMADDAEFRALLEVLAHYPGTSLQIILDTFRNMTAADSLQRLARLSEDLAAGKDYIVPLRKGLTEKMSPGQLQQAREQAKE